MFKETRGGEKEGGLDQPCENEENQRNGKKEKEMVSFGHMWLRGNLSV